MVNNHIITPTTSRYTVSANWMQQPSCSVVCRRVLMTSRRGCQLNAAECRQDGGNLVFINSSSTSNSSRASFSQHSHDHAVRSVCDLGIWFWCLDAVSCCQHSIELFHHPTPSLQYSSVSHQTGSAIARRLIGVNTVGLLQHNSCGSPTSANRQTSVYHEHSR